MPDHRPYLAVGVGPAGFAVSCLAQAVFLGVASGDAGAWWDALRGLLHVKTLTGLLIWPIGYAGLVLWRLCRGAGARARQTSLRPG